MNSATHFTVSKLHEGQSLVDILAAQLECSKKHAKLLLDERKVFVNNRRVWMAKHKVKRGDTVEVQAPEPTQPRQKVQVLFENEDFLVIDKPAGMLSDGKGSVEFLLRKEKREDTLRAVHRLDRDTSGCLLFARNEVALSRAIAEFSSKHVQKEYLLISIGPPPRRLGEVSVPLDGKPALSRFALVAATPRASLIQATLITGRMHQIRKHLRILNVTIAGDKQYGRAKRSDKIEREVSRQMLHAWKLRIPALKINAHCAPPDDFVELLTRFRIRTPQR